MTTTPKRFFQDKVVVVTGAGRPNIGKALAEGFAKQGARVVVTDIRGQDAVASQLCAQGEGRRSIMALPCDVTNATQVEHMIETVRRKWGRIDIYCSNAGYMLPQGDNLLNDNVAKFSDRDWQRVMDVNVLSHVIAIRALMSRPPHVWDGIFVVTASAAGLLAMFEDTSYGVSKAAAVSFAEHLAIVHPSIQVHCLCPEAVDTPFIPKEVRQGITTSATVDGFVTPAYVAECTLDAIKAKSFWIFPHTRVPMYVEHKALSHDRWLKGMQRLRERLREQLKKQQSKL